ncbi:MAG: hypothetical protein HC850_01615 [Rhodomicrobium sp.]|nr:hypothetical protein [Rhodomicrobium sp.]
MAVGIAYDPIAAEAAAVLAHANAVLLDDDSLGIGVDIGRRPAALDVTQ